MILSELGRVRDPVWFMAVARDLLNDLPPTTRQAMRRIRQAIRMIHWAERWMRDMGAGDPDPAAVLAAVAHGIDIDEACTAMMHGTLNDLLRAIEASSPSCHRPRKTCASKP